MADCERRGIHPASAPYLLKNNDVLISSPNCQFVVSFTKHIGSYTASPAYVWSRQTRINKLLGQMMANTSSR